jgi:hypothetical protein
MRTKQHIALLWLVTATAASAAAAQAPAPSDGSGVTIISRTTSSAAITALQLSRLTEKLALVDRIMSTVAAQAGASTDDQLKWLRERLYGTPLAQLKAMGMPLTFQAASAALARTALATKDLGDPQTDLVYRPITPCRYIDTRNVGGPIVGTRDFDLNNTGSTYGGSGTCDPKATAPFAFAGDIAAININVTIIGPGTAPGFIGARPQGSANTTSLVNWYEGGPNVQAANAAVVSTGGTSQVEFFGSPVNIVVDVMGIFTMPAFAPPKIVTTVHWFATPGAAGLATPIPADRPVQILATILTPSHRGVSQVNILQCCGSTPTFLEWVGLNSPNTASITSGFSSTLGTPILKMDFDGEMLIEVNDASTIRLHNTSATVSHEGIFSIVEY